MTVELGTTPEAFADDFFNSYVKEVVLGSEDPARSIDRFYTPDFVQTADGAEMDRAGLVEHVPTSRQTFETMRYEVLEALHSGSSLALRLSFKARMKNGGGAMEAEFYIFAELAEDRRIRRIHQMIRQVGGE